MFRNTNYISICALVCFFIVSACQAKGDSYGDLLFSTITTQQKFHIENRKDAPAASYKLNLVFAEQGDEITKNWINNQFVQLFFGERYKDKSPEQAELEFTEAYRTAYLTDITEPYLQELSEVKSPDKVSFWYNYEFEMRANIESYQDKLVTLKTFTANYTGGAHGMYSTNYFNLDLEKQKVLYLKDILVNDYEASVKKLIISQLQKDYQTTDLTDKMITVSDIYPTENFLLHPQGITFCFTPYEIAAYAAGEIEVTLSFKQLKHLLRPNSAIPQLWM